ncbi:hypothetical protein [Heliomarina baculiformis]|uniref:hypothetical protein n=1 Tax=Heliomarina baculiformis TaxID=2872036 RepID=UPI001EE1A8F8|nr:hypothetical protein [Heliomarina baculiformis]
MENPTIDELLDLGPTVETPQDDLVTSADLGSWLGLTSSRVNQLARDSIIPRVDVPGGFAFPLKQSVQAYAEHLRNRSVRNSDPRLADEKLRVAAGQADKLDIQNQKARGELIPANAVRAEWLTIVADLRARLLAVPSRVAAKLSLDRPATAALDVELRRAMQALSETANEEGEEITLGADSAYSAPLLADDTETPLEGQK